MEMLIADNEKTNPLSDEPENILSQYDSIMVDFIFKFTLATVLFFASFPWAALFWAPYHWRWDE